jgi:hypothetical protein
MKYLVQIKQDLTACSTVAKNQLNRIISESLFDSESQALDFYQSTKNNFKFAGLAGQYVTYPQTVEDNYKVHTHTCDHCGERFTLSGEDLGFTELNGDYCSRGCFRNSFQSQSFQDEEQYYDDY